MKYRLNKALLAPLVLMIIVYIVIINSGIDNNKIVFDITGEAQEGDANIFFLETGESTDNVTIGIRAACSIEAAALANPQLRVFVLFTDFGRLKILQKTPAINVLLHYPNIMIDHILLKFTSLETPMEEFFKSEALSNSKFKKEHDSEAMKLLLLWKVGGTFLDYDMLVRESLESWSTNYACAESDSLISNAFLSFDVNQGRELLKTLIQSYVQSYNGESYTENGSILITDFAKKMCNVANFSDTKTADCSGFHIMKKEVCNPIPADRWQDLMSKENAEDVMKKLKDSRMVHLNHQFTKDIQLSVNSKAPYIQLARKFCPKVFATCNEFF